MSSHNYLNSREEKYYQQEYRDFLIEHKGVKHLDALLLDSSLISTTKNKKYYFKVIDCGKYKQVYYYNDLKIKKDNNLEKNKKIDSTYLFKKENIKNKNDKKLIEIKNINRSVFKLQRLIKANEEIFKTFITLTFDEDLKDIEKANKRFRYWRDSIQRTYKDFKYVCVPEFQKNGRVHYHMLTNLSYQDNLLINENISYTNLINKFRFNKYKLIHHKVLEVIINKEIKLNELDIVLRKINNKWQNTKKTYNYKSKNYKIFKTIKYWSNGFSNVCDMENVNIIGYLTKYMTKDIDERLFGKKRYLNSQSLVIPKEYYIDCENDIEFFYILDIVNNSKIVYKKDYLNFYEEEINFVEYKIKE